MSRGSGVFAHFRRLKALLTQAWGSLSKGSPMLVLPISPRSFCIRFRGYRDSSRPGIFPDRDSRRRKPARAGNGILSSKAGSITFIPKGVSYKTEILEDMRMVVVHFKLDRDINYRNASVIFPGDAGFHLLFERIVHDFHTDKAVDFRCMSAFYELLRRLIEKRTDPLNESVPFFHQTAILTTIFFTGAGWRLTHRPGL